MFQAACDKETVSCVEECVIASEELQTLGGLVRTDIKAVNDSVLAINGQIEQLELLFQKIDHLEKFVEQVFITSKLKQSFWLRLDYHKNKDSVFAS